jgi:predicted transcriptional regulator YheO
MPSVTSPQPAGGSQPLTQTYRRASRQLDEAAAELEEAGSFEQADAIRRVAERLRVDARSASDSRGTIVR